MRRFSVSCVAADVKLCGPNTLVRRVELPASDGIVSPPLTFAARLIASLFLMSTSSLADEIRRQVRHTLTDQGADAGATLCESILVRGGFLCGRRFELDGFSAIWFVEERQLKYFDRSGTVFDIARAGETAALRRAA